MNITERIQRSRALGAKLPAGCVCVTRPGKWGNPFILYPIDGSWYVSLEGYEPAIQFRGRDAKERAARAAVLLFRSYAMIRLKYEPEWLAPLYGKSLACWCPLQGSPCHADVLLELTRGRKCFKRWPAPSSTLSKC